MIYINSCSRTRREPAFAEKDLYHFIHQLLKSINKKQIRRIRTEFYMMNN
ncbi:unknown protein [Cronobacter turicensis z3032]|uniref:Uncharacterized protein n=1 Tax=Cronobacter turicensis (strain DSM 18703 / CCUG 55852 / LMG 23827 / z3032) TaxID=693216 RepID=C9XXM5_CROTZ|nr:unknown protein [Cronobacter turicensis z3032]